jgi:protein-disulfide isomerase
MNVRSALDVVASLSMIAAAGALFWTMFSTPSRRRPDPPLPKGPVLVDTNATIGQTDAPVAIVEYADFECPYCLNFARDVLPSLEQRYISTGKVYLALRHLPIEKIHANAMMAANAADCAFQQGKGRAMHDSLFNSIRDFDSVNLIKRAPGLGLDPKVLETCAFSGVTAQVQKDMESARVLNVTTTPTFFIGHNEGNRLVTITQRINGLVTFQQFETLLDRVLSKEKAFR